MFKIVPLIALVMLALTATASGYVPGEFSTADNQSASRAQGQDFRSPDAIGVRHENAQQSASLVQDLRSPDGAAAGGFIAAQDLRSPDGRSTGDFSAPVTSAPVVAADTDSFAWGYLAALIAIALIGLGWVTLILHRRRTHRFATGQ